jgi:hypothetical protein
LKLKHIINGMDNTWMIIGSYDIESFDHSIFFIWHALLGWYDSSAFKDNTEVCEILIKSISRTPQWDPSAYSVLFLSIIRGVHMCSMSGRCEQGADVKNTKDNVSVIRYSKMTISRFASFNRSQLWNQSQFRIAYDWWIFDE